jgi:hypothetical protein
MSNNKFFIFFISWLFPGAGHLFLKKYFRASVFFSGVIILLVLGVLMKGKLYGTQEMHPLLLLGFFGDLGNGIFYFIIDKLGIAKEATNITAVTYHYGTTYIATAGLLNYLISLNAFDIAKKVKK